MIEQIIITIGGFLAIWLSQSPHPRTQRWGPVIGLVSQPAWFYASYLAEQWGIFLLSIAYTAAWLRGFRNHWRPATERSAEPTVER
jgi:hypothetical protein